MSLRSEIIRVLNEWSATSKKISELPAGTTPAGTELIEGVQGGESVSFTISQVSSGGSGVLAVVAGTNVTVDDTDPQNPIVSASGGGGGSVTSVNGDVGPAVVLDATDVGADPAGSASTVATNLSNHIADATDAHAGTAITNTPAGNIAATTVQAAINELDTEKEAVGVAAALVATEVTDRNAAIASAVVGLMDYRGVFDASVNAYPSSGGSGSAGAILKSDFWIVSVAGTLPTGLVVAPGDLIIAKQDTPGNTQANWSLVEYNIGYTPENAANKTTGFGTLNNTLFPTTQAVATYVASLTGGGYTDVAYVNTFSGVDPTGVADSKTGLQAAMASGKKVIVFDGLYKTTDMLTINANQTVILRGGTNLNLYGNVNTGSYLFEMNNGSNIIGENGSKLSHTPTGTASYSAIHVSSKYGWSIDGKMRITGFGTNGIFAQGAGAGNNQFKNGFIRGVICENNINNGFGGTNGNGHGIKLDAGCEYVYILDCEIYENGGFGVLNLGGANNPIINTKIIKNTLGGLRIIGHYTNNTDHFNISSCQINHNDAVGTYNIWVSDIDTGINFDGCSIYGGTLIKSENSRGISFNGCGLSISGTSTITPGTDGDGIININGGHVIGSGTSIEGFKNALLGGGQAIFNNIRTGQLATTYASNFTAGVDSWTASGTTNTGNIDAISDGVTSFDNTLRIAGDAASSAHYVTRPTTLTIGTRYKLNVTVYMPSANTAVNSLKFSDSGGTEMAFQNVAKGKWITLEREFTATGTTINIHTLNNGNDIFTSPSTDYLYIARVMIFTAGTPASNQLDERRYTGSAILDFPSVSAGATEVLTMTVTGAVDGDEVYVGIPNASQNNGIVWKWWVSAANTVTIAATNITAGAIDPASGTFKASVIKR